jgi:DNA adenine methylase
MAFLRWPGGKRWLVPFLLHTTGGLGYERYFEPFLGGAAVFFGVAPPRAQLSDINRELVDTYTSVRDFPQELVQRLMAVATDKATYLAIRRARPTRAIDSAVRFIYLNRLGFNGMYRVNRSGHFNVPYAGDRNLSPLWNADLIAKASVALRGVAIAPKDFGDAMGSARDGDFIYCDPTYTTMHNSNCFRRYNEKVFSWSDQERLAESAMRASHRGAVVVISNANHNEVANLYSAPLTCVVTRSSTLAAQAEKRCATTEALYFMGPSTRLEVIRNRIGSWCSRAPRRTVQVLHG